jgi:hypothetical protein
MEARVAVIYYSATGNVHGARRGGRFDFKRPSPQNFPRALSS